jgi:hypothetical protein
MTLVYFCELVKTLSIRRHSRVYSGAYNMRLGAFALVERGRGRIRRRI